MKLTRKWWLWLIGFSPTLLLLITIILDKCLHIPVNKDNPDESYLGLYLFLIGVQIFWLAWGGYNLIEINEENTKSDI